MKIIDINGHARDCTSAILDKDYPGFIRVDYISKIRSGFKHSEWIPANQFLSTNPAFKKTLGQTPATVKEDLGVVSKSGQNFLQDSTKNWPKNAFVNTPLWISRGTGEGQQRLVVKNDQNKLFIDQPWKIRPNKTSQYVLSFNVQKNIPPMGNVLPGIETKNMVNSLIKKAKKSLVN